MKNLISLVLLLGSLIVATSCSDNLLNEDPRDEITAESLYKTSAGFENGLNALYAMVRLERINPDGGSGVMNGARNFMAQGSTDDYYRSRFGSIDLFYVEWQSHMNSETNMVENYWEWLYEIINGANSIIDRSENSEVNWQSETQKNEIVAQARFVRAWAYRHLIHLWGDVPLTLNESTGRNIKTNWTRESKSSVLEMMEEDWLFAEQHLPEVHSQAGRLNKAAAQHYLAELYLMMDDPATAEEKAQSAINNPNFSLITERYGVKASQPGVPFMDQFYDGNVLHNQGNTEVLWEMPHNRDAIGGGGNWMRRSWLIRYSALSGVSVNPEWGRGSDFYAVTKHAWSLYEEQDDRYSEFAVHHYVVTDEGDTLYTSTEDRSEPIRDPLWPSTAKWDDGDPNDIGRNEGYVDQPYLRLAETYLLLAEAQHLQGKNGQAAENLNIIRRRANASEITAGDVSIDFILDERTRELLTEEHRRYTLLRLDKWLERTREYNTQSAPYITERDKLLPIPQSVIDANLDTPMEQNPGY